MVVGSRAVPLAAGTATIGRKQLDGVGFRAIARRAPWRSTSSPPPPKWPAAADVEVLIMQAAFAQWHAFIYFICTADWCHIPIYGDVRTAAATTHRCRPFTCRRARPKKGRGAARNGTNRFITPDLTAISLHLHTSSHHHGPPHTCCIPILRELVAAGWRQAGGRRQQPPAPSQAAFASGLCQRPARRRSCLITRGWDCRLKARGLTDKSHASMLNCSRPRRRAAPQR